MKGKQQNSTLTTASAQTGTVENFDYRQGCGKIALDSGGKSVYFSRRTGPLEMVAGVNNPEFTDRRLKIQGPITFKGERLTVVVVEERDGRFGSHWSTEHHMKLIQKEIELRQQYRVVRTTTLNGNVTKADEEVFVGSVEQMIAKSKRSGARVSKVDQFAPTFVSTPYVATNRFEEQVRRSKGGAFEWVACADPRPFPEGDVYRIMRNVNGRPGEVARGTAQLLEWNRPIGSEKDPVKHSPMSEKDFVFFEVRQVKGQVETWTGVDDPRKEVTDTYPAFPTAPVPAAKKGDNKKKSQFSTTVTSLAELGAGITDQGADVPTADEATAKEKPSKANAPAEVVA